MIEQEDIKALVRWSYNHNDNMEHVIVLNTVSGFAGRSVVKPVVKPVPNSYMWGREVQEMLHEPDEV